jgi:hypothetical protein
MRYRRKTSRYREQKEEHVTAQPGRAKESVGEKDLKQRRNYPGHQHTFSRSVVIH